MAISKAPQIFPRQEYLRRISIVKSEMAKREIDILLVCHPSNITWLCGYNAKSSYVPQGLVVSASAEEPTFITRRMDGPAGIHQTFMEASKIIGYPEMLVGNPDKDGYDALIDFLLDAGAAKRSLGLEFDYVPAQTIEKFRRRLPDCKINDVSNAIHWMRMLKSDLEIAVMKEAAAISDAAIMRAAEVIRPGVREADAIAEISATLARGANGKPGTGFASIFLCASPRTGTAHIPWAEDVFRNGSHVNLELGGVRHSYVAGIMRTFSLGKPSDRLRKLHEAEVAGLEAALEIVRPGRTCGDVAEAFYRRLEKDGFKKESRCGYPIGIDWAEPTASLKVGDMTELKPNMTFHLMLGNWIDDDFGYVISETFRVTASGSETLAAAPRELFQC